MTYPTEADWCIRNYARLRSSGKHNGIIQARGKGKRKGKRKNKQKRQRSW